MAKVISVTEFNYLNVSKHDNCGDCNSVSDYDLSRVAAAKTINDKKTKKSLFFNNALLLSIPIADSFRSALSPENIESGLSKTPLSKILNPLEGSLRYWGKLLAALGIVHLVTDNSETLKKMEKEHPVSKAVLDIAAILTGLGIVDAISLKSLNVVTNNKKGAKGLQVCKKTLDDAVDNSEFAKTTYKTVIDKVSEIAAKYPNAANVVKKSIPYATTAAIGLYLLHSFVITPMSIANRYKENYRDLKNKYEAIKSEETCDYEV